MWHPQSLFDLQSISKGTIEVLAVEGALLFQSLGKMLTNTNRIGYNDYASRRIRESGYVSPWGQLASQRTSARSVPDDNYSYLPGNVCFVTALGCSA